MIGCEIMSKEKFSEFDTEINEEYDKAKEAKKERKRNIKKLEKEQKQSLSKMMRKNLMKNKTESMEEEKPKEKPMPEIMATFNMSQWELMRASNHFYMLEQYYINIYQNELKNWIMPYVAECKNMYSNIHAIGTNKGLWADIKKLELMGKTFVRKVQRRSQCKPPEEIFDLIDEVHFGMKRSAQQQGWRLMAEQRHNDDDDFAGL